MGNYTTPTNIQPYIADIIDANSVPTDLNVESLIEEFEAEVNSWLKKWGLTTPLTDPENIEYLRGKINQGVACDVWGMYIHDTEERPFVVRWCDKWSEFLSKLERGEFALPNPDNETPVDGGEGLQAGYKTVDIVRV